MDHVTLRHGNMRATLLSRGAATQGWWLNETPLILGHDSPDDYRDDPFCLGAIIGRVANRISGASYEMEGRKVQLIANNGENQIHGGPEGLKMQYWTLEQLAENAARLSYRSPEGENGYPGTADFETTVTLADNALIYDMRAKVDRPTPISLAQHNYYTLGQKDCRDMQLQVAAHARLQKDEMGAPQGEIIDLEGDALDFRAAKTIAAAGQPIDDFLLFSQGRAPADPVAELRASNGLALKFYSDQGGAQFYSAHGLKEALAPWSGFCIEPSGYPNAVNVPHFPSVICTPERPYHQRLKVEVVEGA